MRAKLFVVTSGPNNYSLVDRLVHPWFSVSSNIRNGPLFYGHFADTPTKKEHFTIDIDGLTLDGAKDGTEFMVEGVLVAHYGVPVEHQEVKFHYNTVTGRAHFHIYSP